MNLNEKMNDILKIRKSLHMNDSHGIYECWDEMVKQLSENEADTLDYLNHCSDNDLYFVSEVFEDVSVNLKSDRFIQCLRKLDVKYPELEMTNDIDIAESYY